MKNITKVLDKISIDDTLSIIQEATQDPDKWTRTLKENQRMGWFVTKLYATPGHDDIKRSFTEKVIEPTKMIKENKRLGAIMEEIKTTQTLAIEEMGGGGYMKIINQYQLSSGKVGIVLGIAYREDTRSPIKYKYTLVYVVGDDILKEILKEYDVIDRSIM